MSKQICYCYIGSMKGPAAVHHVSGVLSTDTASFILILSNANLGPQNEVTLHARLAGLKVCLRYLVLCSCKGQQHSFALLHNRCSTTWKPQKPIARHCALALGAVTQARSAH